MQRLISHLLIFTLTFSQSAFSQDTKKDQKVVEEIKSIIGSSTFMHLKYDQDTNSWIYVDPKTKEQIVLNKNTFNKSPAITKNIWENVVSKQVRLKYLSKKYPMEFKQAITDQSNLLPNSNNPNWEQWAFNGEQESVNMKAYEAVDYCPFVDSFAELKTKGRTAFYNKAVSEIGKLQDEINKCSGLVRSSNGGPNGGGSNGGGMNGGPNGGGTNGGPNGGGNNGGPNGGGNNGGPNGGGTNGGGMNGGPNGGGNNGGPNGGGTNGGPNGGGTNGNELEQLVGLSEDIQKLSVPGPNENAMEKVQREQKLRIKVQEFDSVTRGLKKAIEVLDSNCNSAAVKTFAVIESLSSGLAQNSNVMTSAASGITTSIASLGKSLSLLAMKIQTNKLKNAYGISDDTFKKIVERVKAYTACHNFYSYGEGFCGEDLDTSPHGQTTSTKSAVYDVIHSFGEDDKEIEILMQADNWQTAIDQLERKFNQDFSETLMKSLIKKNEAQKNDSNSTVETTLAKLSNKVRPLINNRLAEQFNNFTRFATGYNSFDVNQKGDSIKIKPNRCTTKKVRKANGKKVKKLVCDETPKSDEKAISELAKLIHTCNVGYPHINAARQNGYNRRSQRFNTQIEHSDNYIKYCTVIDSCLTQMKAKTASSNSCNLSDLILKAQIPVRGMYFNDDRMELDQKAYCGMTKMSNQNFKNGRIRKIASHLMDYIKIDENGGFSCAFPEASTVAKAKSVDKMLDSYSERCEKNTTKKNSSTVIKE